MKKKRFIITGGGTGGHVFPALCMAEELRSREHEVLYVGTSHGMEAKLVPPRNFPFFAVKTGALKNQGIKKLFQTFFQLIRGILWSIGFLKSQKPQAVIGVGGYVSAPICIAAFLTKIPVFLQEQNSSVGIANRFLGRLAKKVFLGFNEAESYFPKGRCVHTGNPLRAEFFQGFPEHDAKSEFLLIMGGSQGAKAINDVIVDNLQLLKEEFPNLKVLHQTGQKDYESVVSKVGGKHKEWYEPVPFIQNVVEAYGKASLVICRAGALTVSELIQARRPAVFIPYPRVGQNDQITNAYLMRDKGVAEVVEQGEAFPARLRETLLETLEPAVLEGMARRYKGWKIDNGTRLICDEVEALA